MNTPLPATLVGSYPQPDWLVDKELMLSKAPPRVRLREVWRVREPHLEEAQDDATILAVRDQERAGIDIVSDGEIRRESYFNRFANALDGLDIDNTAQVVGRHDRMQTVPRVVGEVKRVEPVQVRDVAFLRSITDRPIKMTVPGPFTMMRLAKDEYYNDPHALLLAYAKAVNEEVRDMKAAGADVIQLDEPFVECFVEDAHKYAIEGINRSLEGIDGETIIHLCFGYGHYVRFEKPKTYQFLAPLNDCVATHISIEAAQPNLDPATLRMLPDKAVLYGVLDLKDHTVETPELVAKRLRQALDHIQPERLIVAPDCGLKYLPRNIAYAKMKAMADGAAIMRKELNG